MSAASIRAGLAARLATVTGLRSSAYYPDQINPPMGIVDTYTTTFDLTFGRGSDDTTWVVLVVVERQHERSAQAALDTYVPLVKAAIEADKSLGGAASSLQVLSVSVGEPLINDDSTTFLAARFAVRVAATV